MSKKVIKIFNPDWSFPPCEFLGDELVARGLTAEDLAVGTGLDLGLVKKILASEERITVEIAGMVEGYLGVAASFWLNGQARYDDFKAEQAIVSWVKKMPFKEMLKFGFSEKVKGFLEQGKFLLDYFGVKSPKEWEDVWKGRSVAFRKSETKATSFEAVSVWLRYGEREALKRGVGAYDEAGFRRVLGEIRGFTVKESEVYSKKMVELLAGVGVVLVFSEQIKGAAVSVATFWLKDTPVIQVCLRYGTDDHFWFTFFHEAGHILLHSKEETFVEAGGKDNGIDSKEREANDFASNLLIPSDRMEVYLKERGKNWIEDEIVGIASKLGISAGIVLRRFQKEGLIPFACSFSHLKKKLVLG